MKYRSFSEGITTGSSSRTSLFHTAVGVGRRKYGEKTRVFSTASKVINHLASKEGLKLSAKVALRAATNLSKLLASPYLAPLIWAPEIIDIATSKEVKRMWNNFKSEDWWKEARKRDEIVRKKVRKRGYSEVDL